VFDPYHINSISIAQDGNLILSMRSTSAVYKIDHRSGRVLWTLGGKQSSFTMGPGTPTFFQHDAVAQADGTLTIFDNGGGGPFVHRQSRGIRERLDLHAMTATLVAEYDHSPPLKAAVQGGMQALPDGDVFLGWGPQSFFSECDASNHQIFDAHFTELIVSYRAYRFPWDAQPTTLPALAVSAAGRIPRLFASWNGATDVSSWRVLAGASARGLRPLATASKTSFETAISVRTGSRYFAVQALDAGGHVLARSRAIELRASRRTGRR
jgi:hypothetical protein